MSQHQSPRLRIPSNYYVYADPPDKDGEETLHFVSAPRRVKLRGRAFREFLHRVVPRLDGSRTVEEIQREVADVFAAEDLDACLKLLIEHGLLEDTSLWELSDAARQRLIPQLNLFQMLSPEPWMLQRRLSSARVAVLGLSGMGAGVAQSLAAAGLGVLRVIDDARVGPGDLYSSGVFAPAAVGKPRAEVMSDRLTSLAPETKSEAIVAPLPDEDAVDRAVADCDFVVNCLDEGQISTSYKLNRVCLRRKIPWTTAAADGLEVIVGPTVFPGETGCFLCYRMRTVACGANPEAAFDFQSHLDRRKQDDSGCRANLVFGTAIAGQLAGLECLKTLSGGLSPTLRGRVLVMDLRDLSANVHVLLRKPWCPACFSSWDNEAAS